ncbi:hypothetical protein PanWU01x14_172130, partial [Parasponia andersonii]
ILQHICIGTAMLRQSNRWRCSAELWHCGATPHYQCHGAAGVMLRGHTINATTLRRHFLATRHQFSGTSCSAASSWYCNTQFCSIPFILSVLLYTIETLLV